MGRITGLDSVAGGGTATVPLIEADGVNNCPGRSSSPLPQLSVETNKLTILASITNGATPLDIVFACDESYNSAIPDPPEADFDSDETEYRVTVTLTNNTSGQIHLVRVLLGFLTGGSWVASNNSDRIDFGYTLGFTKHCAAAASSSALTYSAPTTNEELWSASGSPAGAPAIQPGESKTFSFSIDLSNGYANPDSTGTDHLPGAARDGTDFTLTLRIETSTSAPAVLTGLAGIPGVCGHPIASNPCATEI